MKRKTTVLTPKQKETLKTIADFIAEKHYSPSCMELANALGLKYSSLRNRLDALIAKGYVVRDGRSSRTLRIVRNLQGPRSRLIPIPLVGTVVAGMPVLAEENIEGEVLVEASVVESGTFFALRAKGTSMKEVGIQTGDILVVRQQRLASDGEIVIALLNGESTVKTLRFWDDKVQLIPENKSMRPIPVAENDDFQIQGVVVTWRKRG